MRFRLMKSGVVPVLSHCVPLKLGCPEMIVLDVKVGYVGTMETRTIKSVGILKARTRQDQFQARGHQEQEEPTVNFINARVLLPLHGFSVTPKKGTQPYSQLLAVECEPTYWPQEFGCFAHAQEYIHLYTTGLAS